MKILVADNASFNGSAFIRHLIEDSTHEVLNLGKFIYADVLETLDEVTYDPRYSCARDAG